MREPTTEKLARALTNAGAPQEMIERATSGYYDDFKSDLAFPLQALMIDARRHHLNNIALRAMNGEFDAEEWEAEEWAESKEGQAIMREIVQGGKN